MKGIRWIAAKSVTPKGARLVVSVWLVLAIVLSMIAPSANDWAVSEGTGLPETAQSMQAQELLEESFPSDDGLSALLVFQKSSGLDQAARNGIFDISRWLDSSQKPPHLLGAAPLHKMPEEALTPFFDAKKTTLMLPVRLEPGLENEQVHETVEAIREYAEKAVGTSAEFAITGPAGIAADTLSVFQNADVVLMIATVALIFVLLLLMYRSPLLAVIPLVVSGVLFTVTNRLLGLIGKNGWADVESQALSIMLILLFAVLTDYSMFFFSRYREELTKSESQFAAMGQAVAHVAEPVFFSAGTIMLAVATLFAALYEPYRNFAPVFVTAMAVILTGGITLIPAVFALLGRRAFWPSIPQAGQKERKPDPVWERVAKLVTTRPKRTFFLVLTVLLAVFPALGQIEYSFNLMKSFPESASSRQGFEMLEDAFPKGELAPVTVLLESEQELSTQDFQARLDVLSAVLEREAGVHKVDVPADGQALSEDKRTMRWQMVLEDNPYEAEALDLIERLHEGQDRLLETSGLDAESHQLLFNGQTPMQTDVRALNDRDTPLLIGLVILLITVLLAAASRSWVAPLYMIGTILLTYGSTLGLTWLLFHNVLGYEALSYRIPLYGFVFIVALGVDYNLLLYSRIREEAQRAPLASAIRLGVVKTGKVITSAGLILVATFAVLITQPLLELKAFGTMVALGVLLDTFLVRGLLMPSLMMMLGDWNWWRGRLRNEERRRNQNAKGEMVR